MAALHTYKLNAEGKSILLPEGITNLTELANLVYRITNGEFYSEDVLCIEYGQARNWIIEVEVAARKAKLLQGPRNLLWYFPSVQKQYESEPTPTFPVSWQKFDHLDQSEKKTVRQTLIAEQGEVCAICQKPVQPGRRMALDHCHETGRVRGVLCTHCNLGLGCFRDSVMSLERAISYLIHGMTARPKGTA